METIDVDLILNVLIAIVIYKLIVSTISNAVIRWLLDIGAKDEKIKFQKKFKDRLKEKQDEV